MRSCATSVLRIAQRRGRGRSPAFGQAPVDPPCRRCTSPRAADLLGGRRLGLKRRRSPRGPSVIRGTGDASFAFPRSVRAAYAQHEQSSMGRRVVQTVADSESAGMAIAAAEPRPAAIRRLCLIRR